MTMPEAPDTGNDARLGEFVDRETLRFVRHFAQPPESVWALLIDKEEYAAWLWPAAVFEPRLGGRFAFDASGAMIAGEITLFDPPRRLVFSNGMDFALYPLGEGCRLILTLKRPPGGWSVMAIAGFHGWLGRLTRRFEETPQDETEAWALGIWQSVFSTYERLVSQHVAGGKRPIWRVHFAENDAGLDREAEAQLAGLAKLLCARPDLTITMDGFGDDPCEPGAAVVLCGARAERIRTRLTELGVSASRVRTGYLLGNYHYLVERESAAGRAFNRRFELRPSW